MVWLGLVGAVWARCGRDILLLVLCLTRVPPVSCRFLGDQNQLSGTIPSSLGSAKNLTQLYVIPVGVVVAVWLGLRSVRIRVRVGGRAAVGL